MKDGPPMRITGLLVSLAIMCAACSSGDDGTGTTSTTSAGATGATVSEPATITSVQVVIEYGSLTASASTVPAGTVRFEVTSIAPSGGSHGFSVWRTDLPPDQLPLTPGGESADPTAAGIEVVGFLPRFRGDEVLEVELVAGSYVLIDSIDYPAGEYAPLNVT